MNDRPPRRSKAPEVSSFGESETLLYSSAALPETHGYDIDADVVRNP